ncbi:hypothetical protein [Leptospira wolffii]|uniref:hypothetical protein n=1 Tax=Leptospira wolffii TaxID=409998 RepID=UPI000300C550|nr:hypothetical protein [Leptospira wolffii]EPG65132.1 hypothetical protein LEP1GSC061_3075 [Leptospira wolffii serovar Khorat str. Khorat-H2]
MKNFLFRTGFLTLFFFGIIGISAEPLLRVIEGFEFYALQDDKKNSISESALNDFSDRFLSELEKESQRLSLKMPRDARIFITPDSATFRTYSGKSGHNAGAYSHQSNRFFFQNPKLLSRKGILNRVVLHEICHFLVPKSTVPKSPWIEEAYCESIHPSDPLAKTASVSNFPTDWDTFDRNMTKDYSSRNKEIQFAAYSRMRTFGSWLLSYKGEIWIRNLIENGSEEIPQLYANFLKDLSDKKRN